VSSDLCVGCGICVSMCPDKNLGILTNKYGEYNPFFKQCCSIDCGLCYRVCPFGDGNPNEDEIGQKLFEACIGSKHNPIAGYYNASFVGNVITQKHRVRSASGGLATWLLSRLLLKKCVDAVICVIPSNEPSALFKYTVIRKVEDVGSSAGSAYYPIELSEVLSYVKNTPGCYAITTLPCFAKGIRLAQMKCAALKERIAYVIGIACGQMKNKQYTEYVAELSGVRNQLVKVNYRGKNDGQPSSNFYFSCENAYGKQGKIFWDEGVSEAWLSRWFTLNSCSYCDDVFAECADAVFMDAWLPEYITDWKGTNLVIIRNPSLIEILEGGTEDGDISLSSIEIDRIFQSQSGPVNFKLKSLHTRLRIAERKGLTVPQKRVLARRDINLFDRVLQNQLLIIQEESKKYYLDYRSGKTISLITFRRKMDPFQRRLSFMRKCETLIHSSVAKIRRVRGERL
jgi:coenzyme F420 hydrogenase subunit beta